MKQNTLHMILREVRERSSSAMYYDAASVQREQHLRSLDDGGSSRVYDDPIYRENRQRAFDYREMAEFLCQVIEVECCEDYEGSL